MTKRYIGEIFYSVEDRFNILRNKITMKDDEGNVWYRYEKPMREFFVKKWEVVGKLEKVLSGDFNREGILEDFELDTEYFLKSENDEISQHYESEFDSEWKIYISETNAILEKERLEKEHAKDI